MTLDDRQIKIVENVANRSGLPEEVVSILFRANWGYEERTDGTKHWMKAAPPTLVIREKT